MGQSSHSHGHSVAVVAVALQSTLDHETLGVSNLLCRAQEAYRGVHQPGDQPSSQLRDPCQEQTVVLA